MGYYRVPHLKPKSNMHRIFLDKKTDAVKKTIAGTKRAALLEIDLPYNRILRSIRNDEEREEFIKTEIIDKNYIVEGGIYALAQPYKDISQRDLSAMAAANGYTIEQFDALSESRGYNSECCAKAEMMPYNLEVESVSVRRLLDISHDESLLIKLGMETRVGGFRFWGQAPLRLSKAVAFQDLIAESFDDKAALYHDNYVVVVEYRLLDTREVIARKGGRV